jgi:hypothetical protein
VRAFLAQHGHADGGCIRTDQGGKLAWSPAFRDLLLRDFNYTIEPTGADSPSQNGSVEIYNDKFAVRTRTLLYSLGLPAKFWSAALLHSVYLHNRLVHSDTKKTPFERYYGQKPDLSSLKLSVLASVSNIRATVVGNLIVMTLREFFLDTQLRTKTFCIWTWTRES